MGMAAGTALTRGKFLSDYEEFRENAFLFSGQSSCFCYLDAVTPFITDHRNLLTHFLLQQRLPGGVKTQRLGLLPQAQGWAKA